MNLASVMRLHYLYPVTLGTCRKTAFLGICVPGILAERVGFELEATCGRPSPQPKSRPGRDHG
jgi:hypothetical protein